MHPRRPGEYAPIEEYAVLSDGRTSALVAKDGRVDWWPVPTLDALPVLGALLDEARGGHVAVAPTDDFAVERRYVEGTNVLESIVTTTSGTALVTYSLNMGATGRLPWNELAVRVEGLAGTVPMSWEVRPGNEFESAVAHCAVEQGVPVIRVGRHTVAVSFDGACEMDVATGGVTGAFVATTGSTSLLALIATEGEPLLVPSASSIYRRLEDTKDNWRAWSALLTHESPFQEAVTRSALILKSLLAEYTGAIAAAASTSLPERIGGSKNWDYRFSWVRDSSFAIDALMNLGLSEEVHSALAWLLRAIERNGPSLHVFYTLHGDLPGEETHLPVPGYRESQPVRSGNGAATQLQLGNYGDVVDSVYRYVREGNVLDVAAQQLLCQLADRCCDSWREPDSGIWELAAIEQYTISKIGCWVAFDRMVKLAALGQVPKGNVERWSDERDAVRDFIERQCWSESKQSYTFFAGTDDLDASVLLAARTGFDVGERLAGTVAAVTEELVRGPLLFRYSGADQSEGAFVACTFWMIEALVALGERDRASALMEQAVALTNDVGILSEQIDPLTGAFLGNVPQALSHLALINAAHALTRSPYARH